MIVSLIKVSKTRYFVKWYKKLKDKKTKGIISDHIDRMKSGNFGVIRFVGD
jgi:putative component of toxin-antitoxin plasmid stabilization module